jgi:hypothetical protein
MKADYDTQRAEAPLVTCSACLKAFYMTHPQPVCIACRRKA